MLNGCACQEQRDMVDEYKVGLNYEPENVESLVEAIIYLLEHPDKCIEFGLNAKKLALEKFDRKNSYLEILKRIDEV